MAAPKGNQFWLVRSKHGKDKLFTKPSILWDAACEYFQWVEDNPLWEAKVAQFQGEPVDMTIPKMRAMTLDGLYLFLGIGITTWNDYRNKEGYEDYATVISNVENVIRSQKFAGAAADLLNANIIARDLGLKDESSRELTGPNGDPLTVLIQEISGRTLEPGDD